MTSAHSSGIGDGTRTIVMVSGGGTNLQAIINQVMAGELSINLLEVISDRPGILGLERAEKADIPTFTVDYSAFSDRAAAERALAEHLRQREPELIVLAGFMRILSAQLVAEHQGRMLNIHPSLLPKFRGLNTYRRALAAQEAWHGSTVHFVTADLDAGPSIIQYQVRIRPAESEQSLAARVQQGEYIIYPRAIRWFAEGRLRLEADEAWLDGLPLDEPVIQQEI